MSSMGPAEACPQPSTWRWEIAHGWKWLLASARRSSSSARGQLTENAACDHADVGVDVPRQRLARSEKPHSAMTGEAEPENMRLDL